MSGSGWNAAKVDEFYALYTAFERNIFINSKETGGQTCLADNIYDSQERLLDGICDALANDIHDVKCLKSRQLGICLDPSTRVLKADLTWNRIDSLKVGDEIISVDEMPPGGVGHHRKMRTGLVLDIVEVFHEAFKITMEDGRTLICTGQHPWMSCGPHSVDTHWRAIEWEKKAQLKVGQSIRWITEPWGESDLEDAWFGGMLDGEGSASNENRSGAAIMVCQKRGPVFDRLVRYATLKKHHFQIESDRIIRKTKFGKDPCPKVVFTRMDEIFRLLGRTRPTRFSSWRFWEGRELPGKKSGVGWARIVKIERLGPQKMIDLQTSHKTYIAEGFVSHNTTRARAIGLFWLGLFDGMQGAMIFDTTSHKEEARNEVKMMIENLPPGVDFPRIRASNRDLLTLGNQSTLRFMSAGVRNNRGAGTLGRSSGINLLLASEMCSWENTEGIVSLKQALAEQYENRLFIWESPLALGTRVPTPSGWTTMGEIKNGDVVFGADGKRCRVVGLSPIFINRECFEITFSNGEKIVADGGHKWQVEELRWYTNQQWKTKILTTQELNPDKHRVVLGKSLDIPGVDLPIDPYVLGVWLGDGHSDSPTISSGDDDIEEFRQAISARGYEVGGIGKYGWRVGKFTILGQRSVFNDLGLLGNKHIPAIYLRASEAQRRELLAGLMDTDGHISKDNFRAEFCSIYPHLIDQVAELLASLGIRYSRSTLSEEGNLRTFPSGKTYACRASERLRFFEEPQLKVFNLRRKSAIQNLAGRHFNWRRSRVLKIVSVKPIKSVPVRCIAVDNSSHLFLVGNSMIPTHNTARGYGPWYEMWQEALADSLGQRTIFIGWWAKPTQRIERDSPLWAKYGVAEPSEKEIARIAEVEERYGWRVTQEQLAWYRRKIDPSATREGDDPEDAFVLQDQPWTEDEAFQMTGSSFFDSETLAAKMDDASRQRPTSQWKFFPGVTFVSSMFVPARTRRDVQLTIWEDPVHDASYVIAADPAFGHDERNDRSACEVLRCYADGADQVAEFASASTPTHQFAWLIASLVGWYCMAGRNAVVPIIEINGPGEAVWREYYQLKQIVTSGYLRYEAKERGLGSMFDNVRQYIYARSDAMSGGHNYHWKCLALDTPIPTPSGWRTMGELEAGRILYDELGAHCTVIAGGPVLLGHACFEIEFDKWDRIVADADHLWPTPDGLLMTEQLSPGTLLQPTLSPEMKTCQHRVTAVKRVDSVPVRCVKVDSSSSLFLAGRSLVPTHNTTTQLKVAIMERLRDMMHTDGLRLRSAAVLEEMRGIARDGDHIGSEGRAKDDRVYALAMGIRAWEEKLRRGLIAGNRTRSADSARVSLSPEQRYALFSQYQIDTLFKQKGRARVEARIRQAKAAWRFR